MIAQDVLYEGMKAALEQAGTREQDLRKALQKAVQALSEVAQGGSSLLTFAGAVDALNYVKETTGIEPEAR